MHMELPKNRKTQHIIIAWTTGLNHLPMDGGTDAQPVTTMLFFEAFMSEERAVAQRKLGG